MVAIRTEPVDARMAWEGAQLETSDDWIDQIASSELYELKAAAARLPENVADWPAFGRDDLALPTLGPRIVQMAEELESGRGFVLIRGLDVNQPDCELRRQYWVIGAHLGRMFPQNARGELIGEVADRGGRYGVDPHARGYTSNAEMSFHSDAGDVVALLCVRAAAEGGESAIVSTMAIYNRILEEAPHVLPTLYRGFRYYIRLAETADGDARGQISPVPDATYIYSGGRLTGGINPQSIRSLAEITGIPLSAEEREALECVEALAERPGLQLRLALKPGDLLIVNNFMVLHKRTRFVDHANAEKRRLLLRLWINLHNGRELPPGTAKAIHRSGLGVAKSAQGVGIAEPAT